MFSLRNLLSIGLLAVILGICADQRPHAMSVYNASSEDSPRRVGQRRALSAPPLKPSPGQEWKEPISGIAFVWIPPGTFEMGSKQGEQRCGDELPLHKVNFQRGFWLGKYEVTQAQWRAVMGNNPFWPPWWRGDNLPADWISWTDAQEFIGKLSAGVGGTYRLPTEAEWEYACRAGTTTRYYWGNQIDDNYCWWRRNSGGRTHQVGQRKPNAWGLHDMLGNVYEWCEDVYHNNYEGAPSDGTAWVTGGDSQVRVLRGGSWKAEDPMYLRSGERFGGGSEIGTYFTGLRCVLATGVSPK